MMGSRDFPRGRPRATSILLFAVMAAPCAAPSFAHAKGKCNYVRMQQEVRAAKSCPTGKREALVCAVPHYQKAIDACPILPNPMVDFAEKYCEAEEFVECRAMAERAISLVNTFSNREKKTFEKLVMTAEVLIRRSIEALKPPVPPPPVLVPPVTPPVATPIPDPPRALVQKPEPPEPSGNAAPPLTPTPPPPPARTDPRRITGAALLAGGGTALLAGTVLAGFFKVTLDDRNGRLCRSGECPEPGYDPNLERLTWIYGGLMTTAFVTGLVLTAAGVERLIPASRSGPSPQAVRLRILPAISPDGAALTLSGQF